MNVKEHIMKTKILFLLVLCFLISGMLPSWSATIIVSPGQKIQDAIDSAANGDVIEVNAGTYSEHLNFKGKQITVKSVAGPAATIIEGCSEAPVVTFNRGEQRQTILEGFTIRNGVGQKLDGLDFGFGGGILCRGSSPTIKGNIIEQNQADPSASGLFGLGGGICIYEGAYPDITGNTVRNNTAESGGGIYIFTTNDPEETSSTRVLIQNNVVTSNSAQLGGAIFICGNSHPQIINNVIAGNTQDMGMEIYLCSDSSAEIVTSTSTTTTTIEPTIIGLVYFKAIPGDAQILLQWMTESEKDNAGFNIYRAETKYGTYVKINNSLIPAQGSATQGAMYEFVDTNVKNRKTYWYKLEDVDLNGVATLHGPVSTKPRLIYGQRW